jgi:hypothetical protein
MKRFRLAFEVLGVILYLGAHYPIVFFYVMGSSLQGVPPTAYWVATGLGYLGMVWMVLARPSRLRAIPAHAAFDSWLLAAVPALVICAILIWLRWPLEFPGWDAHGFGAKGWEANTIFFPWLHGVLWIAATRLWRSDR